jgi:hypothetical protein
MEKILRKNEDYWKQQYCMRIDIASRIQVERFSDFTFFARTGDMTPTRASLQPARSR